MAICDYTIMATKSGCYKQNRKMKPTHIIVHSTGADNPNLWRYVSPDNGEIGANKYNNSFNSDNNNDVTPNAVIGLNKKDAVKSVQILPWDTCPWGCYYGTNGSGNDFAIQFEMCEDDLSDKTYFTNVKNKAVELCVRLCKEYKIPVKNIWSHKEAADKGYASFHSDPHNWWDNFDYDMNKFRKEVEKKMAVKPVLDKSGYKKGDSTIGSLALKELLLIAKQLGINTKGMDENNTVGDGTVNAINYMLNKWGYQQNGIAGSNFIKKLKVDISKAVKK